VSETAEPGLVAVTLERANAWLSRLPASASQPESEDQRAAGIWLCDVAAGRSSSAQIEAVDRVLGVDACLCVEPAPLVEAPDLDRLLHADPAVIARLAADVAAATRLGTSAVLAPQVWTTASVSLLIASLYTGDLLGAGQMLRTAVFLGMRSDELVVHAARVIAVRQEPDGGFGSTLLDAEIRLPIIISCLWALIEFATPGITAERWLDRVIRMA
jgi:hypothetical protein